MAFITVQPLVILWPSADKTWLYLFDFYFFCSPCLTFSVNKALDVRISWLLSNLPAGSLQQLLTRSFKTSFGLLNPEKATLTAGFLAPNTTSLMKKIHHSATA